MRPAGSLLPLRIGEFLPIPPHTLLGMRCLANPSNAIRYAATTTFAS